MKNLIFLLSILTILISCSQDLERYNVDPKNPESAGAEYMFSYGQYNLAKQFGDIDYNNNVGRFWANYATQTTYIQESSYDAANRDIGGAMFDNIYTETLFELKKAKQSVLSEPAAGVELESKNNRIAMIKILEVFAYQYLVDSFGDVPYTEALDINNVTPKYDDDEFIYTSIIDSLSSALSMLTVGAPSFGSQDLYYGGDISQWKKFGHSLQLKIGTRLSNSNPAVASSIINAAVNGGVFASNADNLSFNYTGTQPYINPVYDYFVVDSRDSDFVAVDNFLDLLEGLSDPRVDVYYDNNLAGGMVGGVYGAIGNAYTTLTHLNPTFTDNAIEPTVLMDYSTVLFELAEAVERGFINGNASDYYEDGIRASFEALGLSDDADAYISSVPYDALNYKESIGIQKYIALFHNGHEAWTESRRLGVPQLANAASNGFANPKRMIYPVEEVLINGSNYNDASSAMGGDETTSPIFWDVN